MRKEIQRIVGTFSFCVGIGLDQLTPEYKTITWWEVTSAFVPQKGNERFIKPKMINVKPQPFSVQIRDKRTKKK